MHGILQSLHYYYYYYYYLAVVNELRGNAEANRIINLT